MTSIRGRVAAAVLAVSVVVWGPAVHPAGAAGVTRPGSASAAGVRLGGGVPVLPPGSRLTGPAPGRAPVRAEVSVDPSRPAALAALARAVSTPGSPGYRHYLAPGAFADRFGPRPATLSAVRAWLTSRGLRVGPTSADGLLIPVSGTVARVERAFSVPLFDARLPDGRSVRTATRAPLVPASLAPALGGVIGLSTVVPAHPDLRRGPPLVQPAASDSHRSAVAHTGPVACASATAARAGTGAWTADQLASTYGLSSLYARNRVGAGQRVGIYELEPFTASDVADYQACFGVHVPVSTVDVDGGAAGPQAGEAALDIEVVAGLAPSSSITVYSGPNGGTGPLDTYHRMVTDDTAKVITTSWGECEGPGGIDPADQAAENTYFTIARAQGQTIVAAAGDSGSSDCYIPQTGQGNQGLWVDDPADQPDVTGVGGTSLTSSVSTPATEPVWNDGAGGGAGGGGNSVDFPSNPSELAALGYQHIPEVAARALATCGPSHAEQCRAVPDVAASSDPNHGDLIVWGGQWQEFGGTSAASPLWGALTAVVNQGCAAPAGFLNPALYLAGSGSGSSAAFNDVTDGNNDLFNPDSSTPHFPATVHYDLASGWGSPRATGLLGVLSGSGAGCPAVTGLSPASGPATGGRTVVVRGTGFGTGTPLVRFGGTAARVTGHTPTSVTVVTPDVRSYARLPVTVTTTTGPAAGTSAVVPAGEYTFVSPQVAAVVPRKGPVAGGGTVSVTGSDLNGASSVRFGTTPSPSVTVLSSTSLVARVPPGPAAGATVHLTVTGPDGTSPAVSADRYTYARPGYWLVASDGGIFTYGDARFFGSTGNLVLNRPIVGMAATPDDGGYWLVASDGGIFSYGDARFYGSAGDLTLNQPIVGMASTPDGHGYWLVASDGGIFAYGDARFFGSTGGTRLNRPIVGMASTPDGRGYRLVASDGGLFAYGDARFFGSTGAMVLNRPVVGMASTPDGQGYWLVASDGGLFAYGDARFFGSTGAMVLNRPVVGMAPSLSGRGYWLVASDGGLFAYGDAPFLGSTGGITLNRPVVGMAAV
jgi:hypothetical protein